MKKTILASALSIMVLLASCSKSTMDDRRSIRLIKGDNTNVVEVTAI